MKGAFGPDDKLFRLDRVALAQQCANQMFDYEKKDLLDAGKQPADQPLP